MRRFSNHPEEAPIPEDKDPVSPVPLEYSLPAPGASGKEESHTDPPSSREQLEDLLGKQLSLLSEKETSDVQPCHSEEDELCSANPKNAVPVPLAQPGAASFSASSVESHHGSDADPATYHTSAGASNASVFGLQSVQDMLQGAHASTAKQVEPSQSLQSKQRRTRSVIFQQFERHRTETNVAVCKLCQRQVKLSSQENFKRLGTATLLVHLELYHSLIAITIPALQKQTAWAAAQLQPAGESKKSEHWGPTHPMVALYNTEFTLMLADITHPCPLLDSGFHEFILLEVPKWKVPPFSFFATQAMPALECSLVAAIKQGLREALCPLVHFTIDGWEIVPTVCFICFIAHWVVDKDGILCRRQAVLGLLKVQQSDIAGRISRFLKGMSEYWLHPLQLEVGYVAADYSQIAKAVENGCLAHIPSLAYCLNMLTHVVMIKVAGEDASLAKLLYTLQEICRHFQQSEAAVSELQSKHGLPREQLPQEPPATWRAILRVMQLLLAQECAFHEYLEKAGCNLAPEDWRFMQHLIHLLKQFDDTITTVRKENVTLGQILHALQMLESGVKGYLQELQGLEDAAAVVPLATELLKSLGNSKHLQCLRENTLYQNAAFLHPHFRECVWIYPKGDVEQGREHVKERVILLTEKEYLRNVSSGHATCSSSGGTIDPSIATEVARKELESYLQDKIDPTKLDLDPMVYWNTKRHTWPSLSVVALQYFSCPPTTVYSDKVLGNECLIGAEKITSRLSLISLNRDWRVAEFRVPMAETVAANP
ncbi:zinc finger BED domain-containing protein 4-like [Hemicordylus capensis]|uniref:zinc finger BED domain-containing protein 4-like n=1 Tax=Hemicordylus capensis TaxID=884348 RepID=UPI0023023AC9|nr:zinc finger BED domain-containing protein 4-like [Hemicordylus capensis]